MEKLHTLRIILGHPSLNDALLRSLFDKQRVRSNPIRKLWLENCRLSAGCDLNISQPPTGLARELDFSGLESVRFRRMPLRPGVPKARQHLVPDSHWVYARSRDHTRLGDGMGGSYSATTSFVREEQMLASNLPPYSDPRDGTIVARKDFCPKSIFALASQFDDYIYESLKSYLTREQTALIQEHFVPSHDERANMAHRGSALDPLDFSEQELQGQRERLPSATICFNLLKNTNNTLTSLCFDWALTMPLECRLDSDIDANRRWAGVFLDLFSLRLPNLKAFQYRNAIVFDSSIPSGLFLLDHVRLEKRTDHGNICDKFDLEAGTQEKLDLAPLEFMEAHPKLQCLSWPMENFFSDRPLPTELAQRVDKVLDDLGRSLVDLRVDTFYTGFGEQQTEDPRSKFSSICTSKCHRNPSLCARVH